MKSATCLRDVVRAAPRVDTSMPLPAHVLDRLASDGVTAGWVADQLGIGKNQAAVLLRAHNVYQSHGRWHLLPASAKPKTYGNARACVSSPFTASDFLDGGRE